MGISEYLFDSACKITNFQDNCDFEVIDIRVTQTKKVSKTKKQIKSSQLEHFLQESHQDGSNIIGNEPINGSLRLLVHEWPPNPVGSSIDAPLPFKNASILEMVITKLRLPRAYLLDFARKQYVPARLTITEKKNEQNFDIVCQSPNFRKSFTTMALSYDPQVRTTTGFLGLTTGQMREILEILDQLDCYAAHPILLPILMYAVCSNMLRRQLRDVNREVDFVQHQTGLLDGYLRKGSATLSGKSPDRKWEKPDYDDLHRILVEQHASLTTDLSYFVSDLGLACTEAMHTIKASGTDVSITSDTYIEMHSYLLQLKNSAEFQLQHRERMLSRIDMQLKVLYNLMQQNIANQTLRDSSTMKGIALLTMVFLPSTALAAIFSMSPFFSGDPNNSRLIVSGNIWVFWATAIPVTIAVIVIFAVWTEWAEFRRFLSSGRIEQASAV